MPSFTSLAVSHTRSLPLPLPLPLPLVFRTAAIKPRCLRAASKAYGNEAMDGDSIAGDLGLAALAALKSNPPIGSSDKEGSSAPLSGSDVLRALQRATARREKKKRRRFGRKEKSDAGGETTVIDGAGDVDVRPIEIRSDWGSRIEELEVQIQRLLSLYH